MSSAIGWVCLFQYNFSLIGLDMSCRLDLDFSDYLETVQKTLGSSCEKSQKLDLSSKVNHWK